MDSSNTVIVSVMVEEKGRQTADKKEGRKPWTLREFGGQTVWDWLHLLSALAIPVVLAAAGLWFTAQQDHRQEVNEGLRAKQAQKIEDQRADAERKLAEQRAQDEALQAYLNQMSQLMLDRKLLETEQSDPVHTLVQARTVTILRRLNSDRNRDILQFLQEASQGHAIVILNNSNLSEANLKGANLDSFDLQRTDLSGANLRDAYLAFSDLSKAKLNGANLRGADLHGNTDLSQADLSGANLRSADLHGDTDLSNTNLSEANLSGTDLIGANLKGAVLSGAKVTDEHLAEAKSLEGATMPNGQKYEDWIKDREKRQQDE